MELDQNDCIIQSGHLQLSCVERLLQDGHSPSLTSAVGTEQARSSHAQSHGALIPVSNVDTIETAFAEIVRLGARGAIVSPDSLFGGERERIAVAAKAYRTRLVRSTLDRGFPRFT
jgi:hypothetical protein